MTVTHWLDVLAMDRNSLKRGIEDWLGRDAVSPERLDILEALTRIYEDELVLADGRALPLWSACACGPDCWRGLPESAKPDRHRDDSSNGGIVLPWVGAHYAPGGVAVLGVNLREASGLFVEYEIASGQLEHLSAGGYKPHGSWWAYRTARSAAAVMRSMAKEAVIDVTDPAHLTTMLDGIARVQAVKCSPEGVGRSDRTHAMDANCPPRYLGRELAVLRPRALMAFGQETWDAIERTGVIEESVWGDDFSRSSVSVEDLSFEMFWLHHPADIGDRWQRSHNLLLSTLQQRPIARKG